MGKMNRHLRFKPATILTQITLWLFSLTIVVPLLMALITSFKTSREAALFEFTFPAKIQWINYLVVFTEGRLLNAFRNGIIISVTSVGLTILFSSLAAYVLARNKTKLNKLIYYFFILGLIDNIAFIPTIKTMQVLHIMNTIPGIILLYMATSLAFCIFLYHGFFNAIPRELDEAATIDGCSPLKLFFKIIFPLLKPINLSVIVFVFMGVWNDFQFPLYFLNNSDYWTMPMTVFSFFGKYSQNWNLVFADIVMTILPVMLLYFFGQRFIVQGLTAGAVKG